MNYYDWRNAVFNQPIQNLEKANYESEAFTLGLAEALDHIDRALIDDEIGIPVPYSTKHGSTDFRCYVAVLPLNVEQEVGGVGTDSLMALTFAIENVRQILRVFVKLGDKVYFKGSKTPIDLDDRLGFLPVNDNLVRPEYRE